MPISGQQASPGTVQEQLDRDRNAWLTRQIGNIKKVHEGSQAARSQQVPYSLNAEQMRNKVMADALAMTIKVSSARKLEQ